MVTRRGFLSASFGAAGLSLVSGARANGRSGQELEQRLAAMDAAAARPVLERRLLPDPVIIESFEFLRRGRIHLVRVRARGGAEAVVVSNERDIGYLYPVAQELMVPYLVGKDARDWEDCLEGVYLHRSNYKRQGLLFWLPLASLEFAVLELLGRIAGRPVVELVGGRAGVAFDLYHAHNDRERTAEESVERMVRTRDRLGLRAAKFKVGGRMRRNADSLPGRTEAIIPLARERLGPDFTLYADSNGSFDVARGIEVGRLCQRHGVAVFEEPVPHDQYEETAAVADALDLPVAGGEQESSHHRFRAMIARQAVDVVQPDLFYFGGMVRSLRVAHMAAAVGLECSPHISGTGLGFLYMAHFVGALTNAGPFQEYKGFTETIPVEAPPGILAPVDGKLMVPGGPGFGVNIDPEFIAGAEALPPLLLS